MQSMKESGTTSHTSKRNFHISATAILPDAFCLYSDRHSSRRYYAEQNAAFVRAKEEGTLLSLVRKWFPQADIAYANKKQQRIDAYFHAQDILNVPLEKSTVQEIKAYLEIVIGQPFLLLQSFYEALWLCNQESLWQYNEPKLRQTNHHKDRDRQNVKGGESFSRFLLYRKICPQRQPTLRVGAKLAAAVRAAPVLLAWNFCLGSLRSSAKIRSKNTIGMNRTFANKCTHH